MDPDAPGWPDKEMYFLCDWSHWGKSDGRPMVASLPGNQKAAYENSEGTCAAHELEVKKGWATVAELAPCVGTVNAHVPDERGAEAQWDYAAVRQPIAPGAGHIADGVLIAPNRSTDPELMPGCDWASIEEFAEAVAVIVAWRRWRGGGCAAMVARAGCLRCSSCVGHAMTSRSCFGRYPCAARNCASRYTTGQRST